MQHIIREKLIDVSSVDFENNQGFFFRSKDGGDIAYVPFDQDESVIITVDADEYFNDCRLAKKILKTGTSATNIYIGQGV
jgi:hypothetical protein